MSDSSHSRGYGRTNRQPTSPKAGTRHYAAIVGPTGYKGRPTACRAAAVQIRAVILWVMLATIYSNSESVSAQFEPSLRRIDADIENRDSETRSRISPGAAQNAESRHNRPRDIPPTDGNVACFLTTIPRLSSRLTWSRRNYLRSPTDSRRQAWSPEIKSATCGTSSGSFVEAPTLCSVADRQERPRDDR